MAAADPVIAPPGQGAHRAADAEALFAEAHGRRRRRRLAGGVACLVLARSVAAALITSWPRHDARTHHGRPGPAPAPPPPGFTLPSLPGAWGGYRGRLHPANPASGAPQVRATDD